MQTVLGRIRDLDRAIEVTARPKLAAAAGYLRSERLLAIDGWRLLVERRQAFTRPATTAARKP
jgi:hypothetical protein